MDVRDTVPLNGYHFIISPRSACIVYECNFDINTVCRQRSLKHKPQGGSYDLAGEDG